MRLYLLFFLLLLFSCINKENEVNYFENGNLQYQVPLKDGLRDGTLIKYYENGKIQLISNWSNGIKEGISEQFYDNGNIELRATYVGNKLNGKVQKYDSSGKLIIESYFLDDEEITQSKFGLDGNLMEFYKIYNDTIEERNYYESGLLSSIIVHTNNSRFYASYFDSTGFLTKSKVSYEGSFKVLKDDSIEINIFVPFKGCHSCDIGIQIANYDNEGKIIDVHFEDEFSEQNIIIYGSADWLNDSVLSGLIAEVDSLKQLRSYTPFRIKPPK